MHDNVILKYLFFCHRLPERSFFYKGKQFPICARCTGILLGYIIGITYIIFFDGFKTAWGLLLIIPLVIDGGVQYLGWFKSTNTRRLITGILAGIGTICLFKLEIFLSLNIAKIISNYILG
ncbi:MAG: DUF2085 domain-containing protein [Clostridium sp.]|uniref:DUF2085 domain-containing protein n=1 Tax=Clostridium sp. TaxID=1506 RepID=UPI003D6D6D2C